MWINFTDDLSEPGGFFARKTKPAPGSGPWKMAAITFFDPRFSGSREIIELLDFFDTFSGTHLEILLSGCAHAPPLGADPSAVIEIRVGGIKKFYSPDALRKDVEDLEAKTTWRFSGEIDVVVLRQRLNWNGPATHREMDYNGAMVLNIHRMLADKKITSYSAFFTDLIRFAKDYAGEDPAWDFSDAKLWTELKASLFESFKKYIGFHKFQMRVEDYAIRNIAKQP